MARALILMATYNGGRFLAEQIRSFADQSIEAVDVVASDDGSTDETPALLAEAAAGWRKGRFRIARGPATGRPWENFQQLLAAPEIDAGGYDLVAISDQDDVWLPHKLARGAATLAAADDPRQAVVACSRTALIDATGARLLTRQGTPALSIRFRKPPHFRNALVQSLAGGNTMMLNPAAARLVKASMRQVELPAHDWWIYIIVTAAGGRMIYSEEPDTLYRQHGANVIGDNQGWAARLVRLGKLMDGHFAQWNARNEAALRACDDLISDEARATLDAFSRARRGRFAERLASLARSGVYRQTAGGQAMLYVACALGLI